MSRRKRPVLGRRLIVLAVAVLCLAALAAYLYWARSDAADATLQKAFSMAADARTYQEYVQTKDVMSGRTLNVDGTYLLDDPDGAYASFSTTTLAVAGSGTPIVFTLDNISIGSDLYTRVRSESGVALAVPARGQWQHFQSDDIPSAYAGIAVPGPLLDNLKLFGGGGKYLTQTGKPSQEEFGGATLTRYTFKLSSAASPSAGGTLGALFDRIGKDGLVDAWIDPSDGQIRYLRFQNASYVSTTTITDVNEPLSIEAPDTGE